VIVYQPGYVGLNQIRQIVAQMSGGEGYGTPLLPFPLHILGKNLGVPVGLRVGSWSNYLVNFLRIKTGLGIACISQEDAEDIPFQNWVSFDADTRADLPLICSRIIIMSYLTLHGMINWQLPQP